MIPFVFFRGGNYLAGIVVGIAAGVGTAHVAVKNAFDYAAVFVVFIAFAGMSTAVSVPVINQFVAVIAVFGMVVVEMPVLRVNPFVLQQIRLVNLAEIQQLVGRRFRAVLRGGRIAFKEEGIKAVGDRRRYIIKIFNPCNIHQVQTLRSEKFGPEGFAGEKDHSFDGVKGIIGAFGQFLRIEHNDAVGVVSDTEGL